MNKWFLVAALMSLIGSGVWFAGGNNGIGFIFLGIAFLWFAFFQFEEDNNEQSL